MLASGSGLTRVGSRPGEEDDGHSMPPLSPAHRVAPTQGHQHQQMQRNSGTKRRLAMQTDEGSAEEAAAAAAAASAPSHTVAAVSTFVMATSSTGDASTATSRAPHAGSKKSSAHRSSSTISSKRRKLVLANQERARFFANFDQLNAQLEEPEEQRQDGGREERHQTTAAAMSMAAANEERDFDLRSLSTTSLPSLEGDIAAHVVVIAATSKDDAMETTTSQPLSTIPAATIAPSLPPALPRAKTALPPSPPSPKNGALTLDASNVSQSAPSTPAKPKGPAPVDLSKQFAGLRFVLLQGPELSAKRSDLLTRQVVRRGGQAWCVTPETTELPTRHLTHVLFGEAGDSHEQVGEFVRQLERHLPPDDVRRIRVLSVEWLTRCLKKNMLSREERFAWHPRSNGPATAAAAASTSVDAMRDDDPTGMHHHSMVDDPAPTGASLSAYAMTPAVEAALAVASTGKKRDIKYVMEAMQHDQHHPRAQHGGHQMTPHVNPAAAAPFPPSLAVAPMPSHPSKSKATPSSASGQQVKVESSSSSSIQVKIEASPPTSTTTPHVKLEFPGAILDDATLKKARREGVQARKDAWRTKKGQQQSQPVAFPASTTSPLAPLASVMAQTYSQAVPTFTDTVPYDASQYLPLSTGGSYLNPNQQVAPGASFLVGTNRKEEEEEAEGDEEGLASNYADGTDSPSVRATALAVLTSKAAVHHHPIPSARNAGAWLDANKAHLACQMFSSQHRNLNVHLTSILEQLESMNDALGDKWRTYAYRKTVGILKKYPEKIATQADVLKLAGIRGLGGKTLKKISEILATGTLRKQEAMAGNEMIRTMRLFAQIHGVGSATAKKWYTWGLRTVDQLLTDPRVELSAVQKVGLQFREDKLQRIPRLEVKSILEYVQRVAQRLLPGVTVICCGSFRRGAPTSGDVDLLFTHPTFTTRDAGGDGDPDSVRQREGFLKQILRVLQEPLVPGSLRWQEEAAWAEHQYRHTKTECDRISREVKAEQARKKRMDAGDSDVEETSPEPPAAAAAASSSSASSATNQQPAAAAASSSSSSTHPALRPPGRTSFLTGDLSDFKQLSSRHGSAYYMGFCALPKFHPFHSGISRRIDIKVYPASHFPFALLYFTGSDHFNRSMRFFAKKKSWSLSDHGICPAIRVAGEKVWSGRSVYCATEKDIFDALGLLYVPPEQRNVYAHFDLTEEEQRILRQNHRDQGGQTIATHQQQQTQQEDGPTGLEQMNDVDEEELLPESAMVKLEEAPAAPAAAAAASSSSAAAAAGVVWSPLGLPPLKQEVKLELEQLDEVERATLGLRRLAREEEENFQNQLRMLDRTRMNKQI